jgi:hypothetical protein
MSLPFSYLNHRDGTKHQRAIEMLACESQVPAIQVKQMYEEELAELQVGARITAFLDILAIRKVREMLRQRGLSPTRHRRGLA